MDDLIRHHFKEVKGIERVGREAAVGELRDIHAAGYPNFFGIAGRHAFFHTPADSAAATGPDALEPVVRAFASALMEIDASKK